jgi:hypothetical protein
MEGEWNQRGADRRGLETRRRIVLDAMGFKDDDAAFHTYAARHRLTVNVVGHKVDARQQAGYTSR